MSNRKTKASGPSLQQYPRVSAKLLALETLFPKSIPLSDEIIFDAIDKAFDRCKKDKKGQSKPVPSNPEELVAICIKHLKERSDPILSSYFVSHCKIEDLFELDAVSHEMQRHRMTMGVFYQFLLLELMRRRWSVFDGTREGDIVADIDTPGFEQGVRLYMSVKKSKDTVGGQDIGGVIHRLEKLAKAEKNLTRPYLCVICVATPSKGKVQIYENDRQIKLNSDRQPYSMNCEYWGPGFIFPYITGRSATEVYAMGIKRVAQHLPFMSLHYKNECSVLLKEKLKELGFLTVNEVIDSDKFLTFCSEEKHG